METAQLCGCVLGTASGYWEGAEMLLLGHYHRCGCVLGTAPGYGAGAVMLFIGHKHSIVGVGWVQIVGMVWKCH